MRNITRYKILGVATELEFWGFSFEAETKSGGGESGIESAFLKGSTQLNLLHIGAPAELARRLPQSQKLQIKLEMDIEPPTNATTEVRTQLLPTPYQVRLYDDILGDAVQRGDLRCFRECAAQQFVGESGHRFPLALALAESARTTSSDNRGE